MMNPVEALDSVDGLAEYRNQFALPDGTIYLDGNSLGALPKNVVEIVQKTIVQEWGQDLISSWNSHDWIGLPARVGEKIAPLLGAAAGQVICTDSTSVNLFKLIVSALRLNPGRSRIVTQQDNFPTDIYMAQGVAELLRAENISLVTVPEAELASALDADTALLMLTHVNFKDGRLHDMAALTRAAQSNGVLTLWDLSHSAGVIPLTLDGLGVDFAVGCGYKYLNGGPGAPAYVYVNRKHHESIEQPLSGWMGHDAPFDFSPDYRPAAGVSRFLAGTPGILSMQALSGALDVYSGLDLRQVRAKSQAMTAFFIDRVKTIDGLKVISPLDADLRGSQVSLQHGEAYAIMQALISEGVVGDFRAPDIMRFGFAPLYNQFREVDEAVNRIVDIIDRQTYQAARFQERKLVT